MHGLHKNIYQKQSRVKPSQVKSCFLKHVLHICSWSKVLEYEIESEKEKEVYNQLK